jgi:hypothetical protein
MKKADLAWVRFAMSERMSATLIAAAADPAIPQRTAFADWQWDDTIISERLASVTVCELMQVFTPQKMVRVNGPMPTSYPSSAIEHRVSY